MTYEKWLDRKTLDEAAWLSARKNGIGGSDAAAVAGLNPYESPLSVYYNKTGETPDKASTEAMRQGADFEEYVAQRFTEAKGKKVKRCNYILRSLAHPYMIADVDRMIVGEDALLECKTTLNRDGYTFEGTDFPQYWYCQCMHYFATLGIKKIYLAVLVYGRGFHVLELNRADFEDEIAALISLEGAFWNDHVLKGVPPEVDGNEATAAVLGTIYPKDNGETVDLMYYEKALNGLSEIKRKKAELEAQEEQFKNELKAALGEAAIGEYDRFKVTWKYSERTTLDGKALKAAMPDVYAKFAKTSATRTFNFKEAN